VLAFGPMSPVPIRRALLGLCLGALVVGGCGIVSTSPPEPTPADFSDLAIALAQRGIVIDHVVSGDAGCDDPVLIPTSIGMDASGLGQTKPVRLYLYVFRTSEVFERLRSTIDECARSFVTDAESFESIDQSPYVLAGQGPWAPAFEAALREGLEVAAGNGG
jgi:hypothetical protein